MFSLKSIEAAWLFAALAVAIPAQADELTYIDGQTRLFLAYGNVAYSNTEEQVLMPVFGPALSTSSASIETDLGLTIVRLDATQRNRADNRSGYFGFHQSIAVRSNPDYDGCEDCIYDISEASIAGYGFDVDAFYSTHSNGVLRISWEHSGDGRFDMESFADLDFTNSSGSIDLPYLAGEEVVLTFGTSLQRRFSDIEHSGYVSYRFLTPGIPEPATWVMLIAGFGLVGAAARRVRRQGLPASR